MNIRCLDKLAKGKAMEKILKKYKIAPSGAQMIFVFAEFYTPSGNQRPVERA